MKYLKKIALFGVVLGVLFFSTFSYIRINADSDLVLYNYYQYFTITEPQNPIIDEFYIYNYLYQESFEDTSLYYEYNMGFNDDFEYMITYDDTTYIKFKFYNVLTNNTYSYTEFLTDSYGFYDLSTIINNNQFNLSNCYVEISFYVLVIGGTDIEINYKFNAFSTQFLSNHYELIGFNNGLEEGEILGYQDGYNDGLVDGELLGFDEGYEKAQNDLALTDIFHNVGEGLNTFFNLHISDNITIGTLIFIPLSFVLILFIIKLTRS